MMDINVYHLLSSLHPSYIMMRLADVVNTVGEGKMDMAFIKRERGRQDGAIMIEYPITNVLPSFSFFLSTMYT